MELKQKWMGLVIIFCLIITIGASIGLQQVVNDSKSFHELNTLVQEPLEVSKNVESPNNGTSLNYTWTSWANASDNDNDLELDTLIIYYNFSNFNIFGLFLIDIEIGIYIENNGSFTSIDGDWDEFYRDVEPNESYIWSYEWRAVVDGNYSISIEQVVWGEINGTLFYYEEFFWTDIHQFSFLYDYSVSVITSDTDQDTFDDTIDITYSLNFSYSGYVYLEIQVHILFWNEDLQEWDFLTSDYDYLSFESIKGAVFNWTYQYKAWYDGDYQFGVLIEEDYNNYYPYLVEDIQEWNNARAYNLVNEWDGAFTELDKDGDSFPDSFLLEYSFNYSYTGEVRLRIRIDIAILENSDWSYFENKYLYHSADAEVGIEDLWNFEWNTWETGRYKIDIRISEYETGIPILEETYENIDLCAYEIIRDWKTWTEEKDRDQDGTIDTIRLNYALLFKSAGWMELELEVEVDVVDNGDIYYRRNFITYFQGDVSTSSYYHCYFDFSAAEIVEYSFDASIRTEDDFPILEDAGKTWKALDVYNPVKNISYSTSELDKDNDGLIDTIFFNFELTFSSSDSVILYLEFEIRYYNPGTNEWNYQNDLYQQFMQDVTAGEVYEITIQYSAPLTGDYMIDIIARTEDYSSTHLFEDTVYWYGNEFTMFEELNYLFTPKDSDSDGLNDSLDISVQFQVAANQTLLMGFGVEARYYDDVEDRWISTGDIYQPEIQIFQKEVIANTWYSLNYTWGAPFNDTFNVSVAFSGPYYSLDNLNGYYFFENATKFDEITFETEIMSTGYDTNHDGFNETMELELALNFDESGLINLNISIDVITVDNLNDYESWSISNLMYQYNADVTSGTWYDWSSNITSDATPYAIFILTILDRGVPVFYSLGYLYEDPYEYVYLLPLLPIIPPEPPVTTTTTTTTTPTTTTTTTTTVRITPGWYLAVSLLVITTIITSRRIRVMKK
ncbi:MAG: hypothetical protein ACXADW_19830 [Candidatus Hodarchaeales archaeon]|jgi:hypothetical protein